MNRQVAKRETYRLAYRGWRSRPHLPYAAFLSALVWVLITGPLAAEGWAKPDQSSWRQVSAFGVTKQKTSSPFGKSFALPRSSKTDRLLDLIAKAESPRLGYDAIHHSASRLPNKPPSQMTVAEIFAWIEATPGQHHAIGRYQFIPATLARVLKSLDVAPNSRFSPALQDRLAGVLLIEAGYIEFQAGKLTREAFQDRLAKVWAGLPLRSGKSAYHGIAGNKATVSRPWFDRQMQGIFEGRV
ncbi:MAG: hypothetical protein AAGF53_18705 [Pseudomonadota bacterium]